MNSIKELFKNKNTRLSIRVMLSLLMIFIVYISPALFTFLSNGILGNIVFLFSLFVFVFLDIRLAVVMIPIFILINIFLSRHMEGLTGSNSATAYGVAQNDESGYGPQQNCRARKTCKTCLSGYTSNGMCTWCEKKGCINPDTLDPDESANSVGKRLPSSYDTDTCSTSKSTCSASNNNNDQTNNNNDQNNNNNDQYNINQNNQNNNDNFNNDNYNYNADPNFNPMYNNSYGQNSNSNSNSNYNVENDSTPNYGSNYYPNSNQNSNSNSNENSNYYSNQNSNSNSNPNSNTNYGANSNTNYGSNTNFSADPNYRPQYQPNSGKNSYNSGDNQFLLLNQLKQELNNASFIRSPFWRKT